MNQPGVKGVTELSYAEKIGKLGSGLSLLLFFFAFMPSDSLTDADMVDLQVLHDFFHRITELQIGKQMGTYC